MGEVVSQIFEGHLHKLCCDPVQSLVSAVGREMMVRLARLLELLAVLWWVEVLEE